MAEYLVKVHLRVKGLFAPSGDDSIVVEARNGKEAIEKAKVEIKATLGTYQDEVDTSVLDVHKI